MFQIRAGLSGYVAELTASFLCADLGVAHDPRDNTAAYLASWLAVLKNDKRAIITAGAKPQAAAEYLTAPPAADRKPQVLQRQAG
ncbi:hypothetical protein EN859_023195 [Mesorhizobium sp. M00.F.Ca.ET.216.01.1.1]|nr:hypothetical protein EN859_023195 [Mesorhizobium sp. M00.F.Ca.ET.216.01.1.1]